VQAGDDSIFVWEFGGEGEILTRPFKEYNLMVSQKKLKVAVE
jgi:hypothetical protein